MSDNIIQLNEDLIKHDLNDLVRSSVEEPPNALFDKEANKMKGQFTVMHIDDNKSKKIQILRGLAIIAVVFIHNTPNGM